MIAKSNIVYAIILSEVLPIPVSHTWRSIQKCYDLVNHGSKWEIGMGNFISFWKDLWLDDGSLIDLVDGDTDCLDTSMVVSDFIIDGQWDVAELNIWLPDWQGSKSAYALSRGENLSSSIYLSWLKIWKASILPEIRYFLWLVANDKILTNKNRAIRHLATNDCCKLCIDSCEDYSYSEGLFCCSKSVEKFSKF